MSDEIPKHVRKRIAAELKGRAERALAFSPAFSPASGSAPGSATVQHPAGASSDPGDPGNILEPGVNRVKDLPAQSTTAPVEPSSQFTRWARCRNCKLDVEIQTIEGPDQGRCPQCRRHV